MEQNITSKIWALLRKRYPMAECALLQEVSNGAGYNRTNSADGIVMGLWPSRGLEVHGIEVKISRGDWLREMKKPEKAEAFFKYCDRWYLVIGDESIVKMEEIPPTWGCLVVNGAKLITLKEAPKNTPQPISRDFMAALLKRATQGMIHVSEMEEQINIRVQQRSDNNHDRYKGQSEQYQKQLVEVQKTIRDFENASGLSITSRWDDKAKIGEAVKVVLNGGAEAITKKLIGLKETSDKINQQISESIGYLSVVTTEGE